MSRLKKTLLPMTASKTVADQLREAIRKAQAGGRSLNSIATAADYSVGSLHQFMSGTKVSLNVDTAARLAQALSIKITLG